MAGQTRANYKALALWAGLIITFVTLYQVFGNRPSEWIDWQTLTVAVEEGAVERIDIDVDGGTGEGVAWLSDGTRYLVGERALTDFASLQRRGAVVVFRNATNPWLSIVFSWLPLALGALFVLFFIRALNKQRDPSKLDALNFHPASEQLSAAPLHLPAIDEARAEIKEAAEALKRGAAGPRSVLVVGEPGSGKTVLLDAVAYDSGLPRFLLPASAFVEIFLGVGAARIRKLFDTAEAAGPCIVEIDDIDAFALQRMEQQGDSRVDERATTMLELCHRLDRMASRRPSFLVIVTTSRPDLLDDAMTRPGRFDRVIELPPAVQRAATGTLVN